MEAEAHTKFPNLPEPDKTSCPVAIINLHRNSIMTMVVAIIGLRSSILLILSQNIKDKIVRLMKIMISRKRCRRAVRSEA